MSAVLADTIDIYCPYCDYFGVEVLNDEYGICECNSCGKMMIIVNGVVYTDEGIEYQLKQQVKNVKEEEVENEENNDIDNSLKDIWNNVSSSGMMEESEEDNIKYRYDDEPEIDYEEMLDEIEEDDSTIGNKESEVTMLVNTTKMDEETFFMDNSISLSETIEVEYRISTMSDVIGSFSNINIQDNKLQDSNNANNVKNVNYVFIIPFILVCISGLYYFSLAMRYK